MRLEGTRCMVTGGAGFIGSHLTRALLERGCGTIVYDNLSGGDCRFIEDVMSHDGLTIVEADVLDKAKLASAMKGCDAVFHLAANPDVRIGESDTWTQVEQNIIATHNVLEAMRETGAGYMGFTSTSTVYGEAAVMPTPEDYGPLLPISIYAASKLASEGLISAHCATFGMKAQLFRFANCVGPAGTHGVIVDFIRKLKADPARLEILGDGKQTKSYFHVSDCVLGMLFAVEHGKEDVGAYNVGSADAIDVSTIADIVTGVMGLKGVRYDYTGGVDGGRGWKGDVKMMSLSIGKMEALGWKPEHDSTTSVRLAAEAVLKEMFDKE